MNPLENEKVKEFFGCPTGKAFCCSWCENGDPCGYMAIRVLQAMSEPVKEGELYLAISEYGVVRGPLAFTSSDNWKFHCQWLRLPDQFQKQPENKVPESICPVLYCKCDCHQPAPADPVEFTFVSHGDIHILNAEDLAGLASLVSQAKRQALNERD